MARRAKFGATQRAPASLQATILAAAREMQAQEQRDMFDAWQHGGMGPDGQPVTDAKLLAYIKSRRSEFAAGTADYAQWDEALTQYTFAIGESKQNLLWKQGKISAGQMANWYKGQLSGLNKDTEWYRTVAGNAASWAKQAQAQASAGARGRAQAAITDKVNSLGKITGRYQSYLAGITTWAVRNGWLKDGASLSELTIQSTGAFETSFDSAMRAAGFKGPDGQVLTLASLQDMGRKAISAQGSIIRTLEQGGYSTVAARSERNKMIQSSSAIGSFPLRAQWETRNNAFGEDMKAAQGNPDLQSQIVGAYLTDIGNIRAADLAKANPDNEFAGAIASEITAWSTGKANGPTPQDMFGTEAGGPSTSTSNAEDAAKRAATLMGNLNGIAAGTDYYGQEAGKPGGPLGVWHKTVSANGITDSTGETDGLISIGGHAVIAHLVGTPIHAYEYVQQGQKGAADQVIDMTNPPGDFAAGVASGKYVPKLVPGTGGIVGYSLAVPNASGGLSTQGWLVPGPDGQMHSTSINPFGNSVGPGIPSDGVVVGKDGVPIAGNISNGTQTDPDTGQPIPKGTPLDAYGHPTNDAVFVDPSLTTAQLQQYGAELAKAGNVGAAAAVNQIATAHIQQEYRQNYVPNHIMQGEYNPSTVGPQSTGRAAPTAPAATPAPPSVVPGRGIIQPAAAAAPPGSTTVIGGQYPLTQDQISQVKDQLPQPQAIPGAVQTAQARHIPLWNTGNGTGSLPSAPGVKPPPAIKVPVVNPNTGFVMPQPVAAPPVNLPMPPNAHLGGK